MSVVEISVNVAQNLSLSANTPVSGWSVGNGFTNSNFNLATGEYTCPITGLYSINGSIRTSNSIPQVWKNGVLLGNLNTTYSLVAGDVLDIRFPTTVVVIGGGTPPISYLNIKYYTDQTNITEAFSVVCNSNPNFPVAGTASYFIVPNLSATLNTTNFPNIEPNTFYNKVTYGTLDLVNSRFTVGITGTYWCYFGSSSTSPRVTLRINGNKFILQLGTVISNNTNIFLNTGDYIEYIYGSTGSVVTTTTTSSNGVFGNIVYPLYFWSMRLISR